MEQSTIDIKKFYETNLRLLLQSKDFKPDQLCFAVEQICRELESKNKFVTFFDLKFPNNSPIELDLGLTENKPKDYSYENISFFFLRIVMTMQSVGNLLITRIRFDEGSEDVLLKVAEPVNEKTCAFDFKQNGIKNGFESYFGQGSEVSS